MMQRKELMVSFVISVLIALYVLYLSLGPVTPGSLTVTEVIDVADKVVLPVPRQVSNMSVEEAILLRRSIREYKKEPVRLEHLSLILWASYGVTDPRWGLRSSPSAGATYPLEIYVVVGDRGVLISESRYVQAGVYKYDVYKHLLVLIKQGDFREDLYKAALEQEWVRNAPVSIVITAVYERTTRIYGERGATRYVPMEAGHAGQNVYLMSTALGYGAVVVGAFIDDKVRALIGADSSETPLYIIPLGIPEKPYVVTFEDIGEFIERQRGSS